MCSIRGGGPPPCGNRVNYTRHCAEKSQKKVITHGKTVTKRDHTGHKCRVRAGVFIRQARRWQISLHSRNHRTARQRQGAFKLPLVHNSYRLPPPKNHSIIFGDPIHLHLGHTLSQSASKRVYSSRWLQFCLAMLETKLRRSEVFLLLWGLSSGCTPSSNQPLQMGLNSQTSD